MKNLPENDVYIHAMYGDCSVRPRVSSFNVIWTNHLTLSKCTMRTFKSNTRMRPSYSVHFCIRFSIYSRRKYNLLWGIYKTKEKKYMFKCSFCFRESFSSHKSTVHCSVAKSLSCWRETKWRDMCMFVCVCVCVTENVLYLQFKFAFESFQLKSRAQLFHPFVLYVSTYYFIYAFQLCTCIFVYQNKYRMHISHTCICSTQLVEYESEIIIINHLTNDWMKRFVFKAIPDLS